MKPRSPIVEFVSPRDDAFVELTLSGSTSAKDGEERLSILNHIAHPMACIVLYVGDVPAASGACVATGDWAAIYVMRTQMPFRRRGLAVRVLREAANWAANRRAKALYLQVDGDNHGARSLYVRAGFRDAYPYYCWKLKGS